MVKFEERVSYFTEETSVLQWIVEREAKLACFAEEGGVASTEEEEEEKLVALEALRTEVAGFKTRMIDFEIKHSENVMGKRTLFESSNCGYVNVWALHQFLVLTISNVSMVWFLCRYPDCIIPSYLHAINSYKDEPLSLSTDAIECG